MLSAQEVVFNAPHGVLCCTLAGKVVQANRKGARILGFRSGRELLCQRKGLTHFLAYPEDYLRLKQRLTRHGRLQGVTVTIKKGTGRQAWLRLNAHVVHSKTSGCFLIFHFYDITQQKIGEKQLTRLATTDPLTGLCNRRQFYQFVSRRIAEAMECGDQFGLMFIDLNKFKYVNDEFGHLFGDKVLCAISQRISGRIRNSDVLARIGGDEFCVLVNRIKSMKDLQTLATDIEQVVGQPLSVDDTRLCIRVSIGMAAYPFHGLSLEALIDRADKNMYLYNGLLGATQA